MKWPGALGVAVVVVAMLVLGLGTAHAVSFSVDRGTGHGVPGSALTAAWETGTWPNTIFSSAVNGTNVVGTSGHGTGTSGTKPVDGDRDGQNVNAVHFGPGIAVPQTFYFSLSWYAGDALYAAGSGTSQAPGTGTMPGKVYGSLGDGYNTLAYPGSSWGGTYASHLGMLDGGALDEDEE